MPCTKTLAYQCRLLNKPALLRCRHSIVAKPWTVLRKLLYKISNQRCRILISPIHLPWPLLSGQLNRQIKKRIISFVFVFLFISRSILPNYWLACYVRYPVLFVCSVFIIRLLLFQFIEKMFQVYLALGIIFEPYLSIFWPYLQDCPHVVAKKRDNLKLSFPLLLCICIYIYMIDFDSYFSFHWEFFFLSTVTSSPSNNRWSPVPFDNLIRFFFPLSLWWRLAWCLYFVKFLTPLEKLEHQGC